MENHALNFDIELGGVDGGGGMSDDAIEVEHTVDIDENGMHNVSVASTCATASGSAGPVPIDGEAVYTAEGGIDLEPYEAMEFESEEAAKAFYNSYARRVGFSTRVSSSRRSRRDGSIIQRSLVCAREGFRNLNEKRTKDREIKRPRMVTRVGCKAMLSVKVRESGKWYVSAFVKEHNHELVPPDQVYCLRSHRQISGPAKTLIDTLQAAGLGPRRIMSALIKEYGGINKVGFTEVDCRNYMRNNRQKNIEGDIQLLIDYLKQMKAEEPDFFYTVQGNNDHLTGNVFWADSRARENCTYFGDTVTFDTCYRWSRYRLPFAQFTGVNHHGQPVLLGCAFMMNESDGSFVWLFKSWSKAMISKPPVSITTDHDSVIQSAIMEVFPNTRHRFCKLHIFKKCQEKLFHLTLQHPTFEVDFHNCVNLPDSIDEFESCWPSLLEKYDLMDNVWLQSLYSTRSQWIPVYLRDTFFAETHYDSMNSYFDGYVNASTSFSQFFKLYKKALESRNEKEIKADYDTINTVPDCKTSSPMEKQASEFYTRELFMRFQDELVGTLTFMATKAEDDGEISKYHVARFGEDHKSSHVSFNVFEMKVTCSCQMFEFSGLLCRHVLTIFRITNVLTLPSQYVLKRWTKNAKSSIVFDGQPNHVVGIHLESHVVRYNTLRREAFKFVHEVVKTVEIYDVAVAALEDATKHVVNASKNEIRGFCETNVIFRGKLARSGSPGSNTYYGHQGSAGQPVFKDAMDEKIRVLSLAIESANTKCEAHRNNLFSVLREVESHKQLLMVKVESVKSGMKDPNC